jgi:CRP-like cAMP-binding protein
MRVSIMSQEVVLRIVVDQTARDGVAAEPPARVRKFHAGEAVFQADDSAPTFFVVDSGIVRLFQRYAAFGEQAVSRLMRSGDVFGESAFMGVPRGMTAEALEDSVVKEYDAAEFVRDMPPAARGMIQALTRRIRTMDEEKTAVRASMFQKLAGAILSLAEKDGEKTPGGILIPTKITHEMLAGLIGARRETVTIHLKRLRKLKAVEQRDTGLFVNPENLGKAMRTATKHPQLTVSL